MNALRYLLRGNPLHASRDETQGWRLVCRRSSTFVAAFNAKDATAAASRPGQDKKVSSQPSPPDPIAPAVTFWLHAGDMPQNIKHAIADYTHPDQSMLYPYLVVVLHDDSTNLDTAGAARHHDLQAGVIRGLRDRLALRTYADRKDGNGKLKKAAIYIFAALLTPREFEIWSFCLDGDETDPVSIPVPKRNLFDDQGDSGSSRYDMSARTFSNLPSAASDVTNSSAPSSVQRRNPGQPSSHARPPSTSCRRSRSRVRNDARHGEDKEAADSRADGRAASGSTHRFVAARLARGNHVNEAGANLPTLVAWLNTIHFWAATTHGPAVAEDLEACVKEDREDMEDHVWKMTS
ncbi:hypothetical protein UCRPA7_7450 [Phaeoacremonium minimum UCRPA7]|uniref:Uncharacterized protein n=1 Tax=Phaeoacremonium minimum (strain UCR-PA7) TaxID=1286976 RepID=R8BCM1_PHAM7|nr:hypothetical protein UCRPA7_7450 [Phaeoacremonium minimum UCRPA7]EON97053.1 hypothetical protein UCRPA7_7450 [Phaeoacremonium minimum UCRPA7]